MASDDSTLSQEDVFSILSSSRRRYVIYLLRRKEEPMKVTDLAEEVAAWENDTTPENLDTQERKRVYVSLYQTHIPKLAETGIVDYDPDSGLVELTSRARVIDQYLPEDEEGESFPWQYVYLALAVLAGVTLTLVEFDVAVFAAVSDSVVVLALFGVFVLTVGGHLVYRYVEDRPIPRELGRRR